MLSRKSVNYLTPEAFAASQAKRAKRECPELRGMWVEGLLPRKTPSPIPAGRARGRVTRGNASGAAKKVLKSLRIHKRHVILTTCRSCAKIYVFLVRICASDLNDGLKRT